MEKLLYDVLAAHQLWLETISECGETANLNGADLRWANLSGTNLSEADLRGANFSGAFMYLGNRKITL